MNIQTYARRTNFTLPVYNGTIKVKGNIYYQLSPEELINQAVVRKEGTLSDSGALVIDTGEFTGRTPKDRFIVKDDLTRNNINWNNFNQPVEESIFNQLYSKALTYVEGKDLWVRDTFVCAKEGLRLPVRVLNCNACCSLFAYNMFLRPTEEELTNFVPEWNLVQVPHFFADPKVDGVPNKNFIIINFSLKLILIGGTQYTGEMKKAIFTILNYQLPVEHKILTMHCAANVGAQGDTAIFFGLSGTGKTTLSADSERNLIGDDEHAWDNDSIFNLEGGCYAKTINLDAAHEPHIFEAIRFGALVENVTFHQGTNTVDFSSSKITENTRVSYPLNFIANAISPSVAKSPSNIFFLTADAFGVIPPISKLNPAQSMYYFLSGYTAKIAGTEAGVTEPKPTFSECFGAPFIPLHPYAYADMLGKKLKAGGVNVWMINTGWTGGGYGKGSRIKLQYTRAMIRAALNGTLDDVQYEEHFIFGTAVPQFCLGVPSEILNPENTWKDRDLYLYAACELAAHFHTNFQKFARQSGRDVRSAGPRVI